MDVMELCSRWRRTVRCVLSNLRTLGGSNASWTVGHASHLFAWTLVCTVVHSVLSTALLGLLYSPLCTIVCQYWLTFVYRKSINVNNLFLFSWSCLLLDIVLNDVHPLFGCLSFALFTTGSILSLSLVKGVRMFTVLQLVALSSLVRTIELSDPLMDSCFLRPFVNFFCRTFGTVLAKYSETLIRPPLVAALLAPDGRLNIWKRRRSSQNSSTGSKPRRTSLPASTNSSSFHGNLSNSLGSTIDSALLTEAHGLVTDMLTDASLPAHVTSGLRALAAMLAPPNFGVGSQQRVKPVAPASVSLTDFNSGSDSEEIPYTGERPSTQPKRGRRNMPPSQLRRMSTSTWSTTTSATGMPMLEPEPSRKRSTNFRSSPGMLSPSTGLPSPLPSGPKIGAVKGRSFSTTALPVGTLIQLQERRERRTICSLHPSGSSSIRTDSFDETNLDHRLDKGQYGTKVSDDTSGNSKSKEEPAQSVAQVSSRTFRLGGHSRLNLTSDYDSSNDSPNSSDATADEHGHLDSMATSNRMGRKSLSSTICRIEEEPPTVICSTGMPRCILCGHTLEMGIQGQVAHPVEAKWPNIPPPDVLPTLLDEHGRHMVDSITYDLNELASDPLLSMINEWDYPIFDLYDEAGDALLSQMTYRIFFEAGLIEAFKIPLPEFLNFFRALENGYKVKPYHNSMHAADVLHAVYHLTSQPVPGFAQIPANSSESPLQKTSIGPLPQSYLRHISNCEDSYGIMGANFPALELLALYTAAAMHDYDHPGRTNAFLVSTFAPQAILYNDRSVLENYHAAAAWSLFLSRPEYNWLRNLDKSEFKRFRFLVIEFILATDLKRHFEIVAEFNAKVNGEESPGIDWFSETDRLLVQQMCIKLADINGPCKNHDIHVQWTHRIAEEFYEQGDDEARLGFPVSPFMDRKNPQLAKLQESFINHLVAPLCNAYAEAGLLPGHWEYQETQEPEPDMTEPTSLGDKVTSLETTTSKSSRTHSQRKVVCLHTKHLEENYDVWVKILKEEKQGQQMYCSSSSSEEDESTTPVFNQVPLEEIAEESQNSSEGSGSSGQGLN